MYVIVLPNILMIICKCLGLPEQIPSLSFYKHVTYMHSVWLCVKVVPESPKTLKDIPRQSLYFHL